LHPTYATTHCEIDACSATLLGKLSVTGWFSRERYHQQTGQQRQRFQAQFRSKNIEIDQERNRAARVLPPAQQKLDLDQGSWIELT
jgi:hypothetical protein